jgi:transcriptional regulator with GAF, ATPase, and Fis domain
MWERRYEAVIPQRSERGIRLYSEDDIARLELLAQAVAGGERISDMVKLSNERLRDIAHKIMPQSLEEQIRQLLDSQHELRVHLRQQTQVARFGRQAILVKSPQELYQYAAEAVARGLRTAYAAVYVLDASGRYLELCGFHGQTSWRKVRIRVDRKTLPGRALETKQPSVVAALGPQARRWLPAELAGESIRSGLAVPFGIIHGIAGVLTVHSIDSHVFGADDALFVDAIAQMLAIAADRLRAFAAWEQSLRP